MYNNSYNNSFHEYLYIRADMCAVENKPAENQSAGFFRLATPPPIGFISRFSAGCSAVGKIISAGADFFRLKPKSSILAKIGLRRLVSENPEPFLIFQWTRTLFHFLKKPNSFSEGSDARCHNIFFSSRVVEQHGIHLNPDLVRDPFGRGLLVYMCYCLSGLSLTHALISSSDAYYKRCCSKRKTERS